MTFTFQEIASVGTGFLVGISKNDNGIGSVYKVLNFMTGADLGFHQVQIAYEMCAPILQEKFPWLKTMRDALKNSKTQYTGTVFEMVFNETHKHFKKLHGDSFDLMPLPDGQQQDLKERLSGADIHATQQYLAGKYFEDQCKKASTYTEFIHDPEPVNADDLKQPYITTQIRRPE